MSAGPKMTPAAIGRHRTLAWAGKTQEDRRASVDLLSSELDRARSEEARLLEENGQKDETIKALADALGRPGLPCTVESSATRGGIAMSRRKVDAALLLAGRKT